jgi:hypothetical protein
MPYSIVLLHSIIVFNSGEAFNPHLRQMDEWKVFYHDSDLILKQMLENMDFNRQINYATYVNLDKTEKWYWSDFMFRNFTYQ